MGRDDLTPAVALVFKHGHSGRVLSALPEPVRSQVLSEMARLALDLDLVRSHPQPRGPARRTLRNGDCYLVPMFAGNKRVLLTLEIMTMPPLMLPALGLVAVTLF